MLYFSGRDGTGDALSKRARTHGWLRIAPGLYCEPSDLAEKRLSSKWLEIVGFLYPDAVISHRTAITLMPDNGVIFLTREQARHSSKKMGDLTIMITPGDCSTGVEPFLGLAGRSGDARAWLENFSDTRSRGGANPSFSGERMEIEIEKVLSRRGSDYVARVIEKAAEYSVILGLEDAYQKLSSVSRAMISGESRPGILNSKEGVARAKGKPYDAFLLSRFDDLARELSSYCGPRIKLPALSIREWKNQAFIESYFSNFIEGTEFLIEEAELIVFEGSPDEKRHKDSHDVKAVYDICASSTEMNKLASTADEFIALLITRHRFMMDGRDDKRPGELKEKRNQAGNIVFTDPERVIGTLTQGFDIMQAMAPGYARALMAHFVITQVHPFDDGNGRIARIFMSAELMSAGDSKIIFPTVKREDYINTLKIGNRDGDFSIMLREMARMQDYVHSLPWHDYEELKNGLQSDRAFDEPDHGLFTFSRKVRERIGAAGSEQIPGRQR